VASFWPTAKASLREWVVDGGALQTSYLKGFAGRSRSRKDGAGDKLKPNGPAFAPEAVTTRDANRNGRGGTVPKNWASAAKNFQGSEKAQRPENRVRAGELPEPLDGHRLSNQERSGRRLEVLKT